MVFYRSLRSNKFSWQRERSKDPKEQHNHNWNCTVGRNSYPPAGTITGGILCVYLLVRIVIGHSDTERADAHSTLYNAPLLASKPTAGQRRGSSETRPCGYHPDRTLISPPLILRQAKSSLRDRVAIIRTLNFSSPRLILLVKSSQVLVGIPSGATRPHGNHPDPNLLLPSSLPTRALARSG